EQEKVHRQKTQRNACFSAEIAWKTWNPFRAPYASIDAILRGLGCSAPLLYPECRELLREVTNNFGRTSWRSSRGNSMRLAVLAWALLCTILLCPATYAVTNKSVETIPVSQVHAGMRGVAYTVFEGTKPEPMEVEVLGILKNSNGPKGDIILVRLHGTKAEYTGVVAGMSGSPVYLDGKLAGALAFRIGAFSKEPIAGVTPIEEMLEINAMDKSRSEEASAIKPSISN